jgi:hypothetical protein
VDVATLRELSDEDLVALEDEIEAAFHALR